MNNGKDALVSSKQVTLIVDRIHLVSDGAGSGTDFKAAGFLFKADIHRPDSIPGKPGAAKSFGQDDNFLLVLSERRNGQIREFRFMRNEDKPMNQIDDGDVFVFPDSLDADDMLAFECRSKKYPMKWFFYCKPSGAQGNKSVANAVPPVPTVEPKPAQIKPVVAENLPPKPVAPVVAVPRVEVTQPVAPPEQVAATTSAVGLTNSASAQPKGRSGIKMANAKSLVQYLFTMFCKVFNADKAQAEKGARGDDDCCTYARRATIFLAKELGVRPVVISSVKGMPSQSNTCTQYKYAANHYGDGKTEFAKKVQGVRREIPTDLLPDADGEASPETLSSSASKPNRRGPNKKKRSGTSRTHEVAKSEVSSSAKPAANGHISAEDLLMFQAANAGTGLGKIATAFSLSEDAAAARLGRLFCESRNAVSPFGALLAKADLAREKELILQ